MGATRDAPEPGGESGVAACPAPHHPCAMLHTCTPPPLHANLAAFAAHRTPCPPSCTPHGRSPSAPHSHTVCPPRLPHFFRSVQGCSGVGRTGIHAGAHIFLRAHFHSGGMALLSAAGRLAAPRYPFRTDFLGAPDRFRLGACSEARFACLHAISPSQCTHAISPYQHIPLSF